MRVLFITGSFPPMKCGVGDYTACLANGIGAMPDFAVSVLTGPNWDFIEIKKILEHVRSWRPDIVHIQYPTAGYGMQMMPSWLPLALSFSGVRVVQTWHEPLSWKGWVRYLPNAVTRDTLIVVEPDYKRQLPFWYRFLLQRKQFRFIPLAPSIPTVHLSETERLRIRSEFDAVKNNLVVYFGFASEGKGIEKLFGILDPEKDRLVLICDLVATDQYHKTILEHVQSGLWSGKVFVTGFVEAIRVGQVLAAADAAVFPFVTGVSMRNTSFWAARAQGIFVLTTHKAKRGYTAAEHVYYADANNVGEMREALRSHIGAKGAETLTPITTWKSVVENHIKVYNEVILNAHAIN